MTTTPLNVWKARRIRNAMEPLIIEREERDAQYVAQFKVMTHLLDTIPSLPSGSDHPLVKAACDFAQALRVYINDLSDQIQEMQEQVWDLDTEDGGFIPASVNDNPFQEN
jgi:hypothetical protein